jgi:glycosyltransferase involved in cell wall biosynthesis
VKIAILAIGGVDRSGTERVIPCLLWLIERLTDAGHEVHVFVPMQEPAPGTWPLLGATIHNAGEGRWRMRMLRSIASEHRQGRFDVIHAFWSNMGFVGALASRLWQVPMVLTLPGGDPVSLPAISYGGRLSLRGKAELRIAAAAARRITAPSRYMTELAGALGIDALTVPLGVDLRSWPPAPPRRRDRSARLRLLHVASLNRVKDQPTLLQAMRLLKADGLDFELRMIGVDTLGGDIHRRTIRLGLGSEVSFVGPIRHDRLREHYEWADVLVMASRHEAGPLVMLEAALVGVPTVGTRVGHLADHSPHAAIAVPVGDAPGLAQAIRAVAADETRRLAVAQAAQRFAIEHDAAFTAATFTEIYRDVCGQRPSAGCAGVHSGHADPAPPSISAAS